MNIARVLLKLKVDSVEIIETDYQRVEDRHTDLVVLVRGEAGQFILHIEIQNDNHRQMPWRMLPYRSDIGLARPGHDVRQYLIYIGKAPLTMPDRLSQSGLDCGYSIIDMHIVDCHTLLQKDNPDALVLAILCDFKGCSDREVVHYILQRLRELTGDNESRMRDYRGMLEILSTNRSLERIIEEEQKMLSQVDQTRLPSFRIGMEQGLQQGLQQGELQLLKRLIQRRFGPVAPGHQARLWQLYRDRLERLGEDLFDFTRIEDLEDWLDRH